MNSFPQIIFGTLLVMVWVAIALVGIFWRRERKKPSHRRKSPLAGDE